MDDLKDFLEQYGICILASVVIAMLVFSAVPIGTLINACLMDVDFTKVLSIAKTVFSILGGLIVCIIAIVVGVALFHASGWTKKTTDQEQMQEKNEEVKEERIVSTKKCEYTYPIIEKMMDEIDGKIKEGYTFSTIPNEKWNNVYKAEITKLITADYEISKGEETRIMEILKTLYDDLVNTRKNAVQIQNDISIETMERLLSMDGLTNDFGKDERNV